MDKGGIGGWAWWAFQAVWQASEQKSSDGELAVMCHEQSGP
jgi:hypothetical protein